MAKATVLISSLINIALSQEIPFHQLQELQHLHHSSTENLHFSRLFSIYSSILCWYDLQYTCFGFSLRLGKCSARRGTSYVILCLEC